MKMKLNRKFGQRRRDLGVKHDGAKDPSVVHSSSEIIQGLLMVLVGAVGEIKPGNIHSSSEKLLQHGDRSRSRANGADNFGLGYTAIIWELLQNPLDVYVRHDLIRYNHCINHNNYNNKKKKEKRKGVGKRRG